MKLSDFDYELPKELIAQYPLEDRASCRLMVVDRSDESIRECRFSQITGFLNKNDLLVLNNTKVLTCRLLCALWLKPTLGLNSLFKQTRDTSASMINRPSFLSWTVWSKINCEAPIFFNLASHKSVSP